MYVFYESVSAVLGVWALFEFIPILLILPLQLLGNRCNNVRPYADVVCVLIVALELFWAVDIATGH